MLSQSAEYALRGVLHLARSGAELTPSDRVAEALDVPRNYLSKLFNTLATAGVLVSHRGPKGGFALARTPDRVSVGDVVRVFDPELLNDEGRCFLGQMRCDDRQPCAAHARWKEVRRPLHLFLTQTTLEDLLLHPERAPDRR